MVTSKNCNYKFMRIIVRLLGMLYVRNYSYTAQQVNAVCLCRLAFFSVNPKNDAVCMSDQSVSVVIYGFSFESATRDIESYRSTIQALSKYSLSLE